MPTPGSGDVLIWNLFYQKIVHPLVWGEPGDQARIDKALGEDIPAALDYLEQQAPADGFLFGDIGLADISIATFFRNGSYAGFEHRSRSLAADRRAGSAARSRHQCFVDLLPLRGRPAQRGHQGTPASAAGCGGPLTRANSSASASRGAGMMRL